MVSPKSDLSLAIVAIIVYTVTFVTLNGIVAVISRYFTEFGRFGANYVTVVKLDPYCLQQKCSPKILVMCFFSV